MIIIMNIELSKQELNRVIHCVDKWIKHLDNTSMDRSRYGDLPPLLEKLEMRYRMDDGEYEMNVEARRQFADGEMDDIKALWRKQGRL